MPEKRRFAYEPIGAQYKVSYDDVKRFSRMRNFWNLFTMADPKDRASSFAFDTILVGKQIADIATTHGELMGNEYLLAEERASTQEQLLVRVNIQSVSLQYKHLGRRGQGGVDDFAIVLPLVQHVSDRIDVKNLAISIKIKQDDGKSVHYTMADEQENMLLQRTFLLSLQKAAKMIISDKKTRPINLSSTHFANAQGIRGL